MIMPLAQVTLLPERSDEAILQGQEVKVKGQVKGQGVKSLFDYLLRKHEHGVESFPDS